MLNSNCLVNDEGDALVLPSLVDYGSVNVLYNGNRIPSARLWAIAGAFLARGKQPSQKLLFDEAKRANIYRLIDSGQIVYTLDPRPTDKAIGENVYARKERQRVRFLVDHFRIKLGKIEGKLDKTSITEICKCCANIGLFPIAYQGNRIFFTADPGALYAALGTTDSIRIAVYLKRPSSSHKRFIIDEETTSPS
jgi:hypothetical protein